MKVPDAVLRNMQEQLWAVADEVGWPTLSDVQKSAQYETWIRDDTIGGLLSRYLDHANVRVYLKDTIMKPYGRERIKEFAPVSRLLGVPSGVKVAEVYIKPHGRRLADGKVICWGLSRDWKDILFAVFERAYLVRGGVPYAAVIMYPTGRCQQPHYRALIERAAELMGIEHLVWLGD